MDVSIAICTWNRADMLRNTLRSLTRLEIPAETEWEVLVVDNNSPDHTQQVVAEFKDLLPIHSLIEKQQGTAFARNRVLDSVKGDLLLCTDDDCQVEPNWLREYLNAAAAYPQATFFAGRIEPVVEGSHPSWIVDNIDLLWISLACLNLGQETRLLTREEHPFGANMAFRRSALAGFRFNTSLGPVGGLKITGEETDLCERMIEAGHLGVWVGPSMVHHSIPEDRLQFATLTEKFVNEGRTQIRKDGIAEQQMLLSMPRWILRQYAVTSLKLATTPRNSRDFLRLHQARQRFWGMLREARTMSRTQPAQGGLGTPGGLPPHAGTSTHSGGAGVSRPRRPA